MRGYGFICNNTNRGVWEFRTWLWLMAKGWFWYFIMFNITMKWRVNGMHKETLDASFTPLSAWLLLHSRLHLPHLPL